MGLFFIIVGAVITALILLPYVVHIIAWLLIEVVPFLLMMAAAFAAVALIGNALGVNWS